MGDISGYAEVGGELAEAVTHVNGHHMLVTVTGEIESREDDGVTGTDEALESRFEDGRRIVEDSWRPDDDDLGAIERHEQLLSRFHAYEEIMVGRRRRGQVCDCFRDLSSHAYGRSLSSAHVFTQSNIKLAILRDTWLNERRVAQVDEFRVDISVCGRPAWVDCEFECFPW